MAVVSPVVTLPCPDRSVSLGTPRIRGRPLETDRSGLAFWARHGMISVADPFDRPVWGTEPRCHLRRECTLPSTSSPCAQRSRLTDLRVAEDGLWRSWPPRLAPALAAIWAVPWFVTQDGPAHVYNAQILAWSFDPTSPFRDVYTVRWQPIPNWAGPLTLAGLVAILPAWVADRIMTSLTLAAFAAAIFWLRWRVAGGRGLRVAALLASLLAMNMAWLFGFTSFMLGACLFPITLGIWWPARDRLSRRSSSRCSRPC